VLNIPSLFSLSSLPLSYKEILNKENFGAILLVIILKRSQNGASLEIATDFGGHFATEMDLPSLDLTVFIGDS